MISPLMELRPKNLRGKAFRFGIFWNPRPAEKSVLLPLFGHGNYPDRGKLAQSVPRRRAAAIARRFHRSCFVGEALVRSSADEAGARRELFCIMIPVLLDDFWRQTGSLPENQVLWAMSQMQPWHCDNLKNLAFLIEPPANPIRPTLRDGH
jgi:hypothetical protein